MVECKLKYNLTSHKQVCLLTRKIISPKIYSTYLGIFIVTVICLYKLRM